MVGDFLRMYNDSEAVQHTVMLAIFAILCIGMQLDIQNLVFALVGASTYALLQIRLKKGRTASRKMEYDDEPQAPPKLRLARAPATRGVVRLEDGIKEKRWRDPVRHRAADQQRGAPMNVTVSAAPLNPLVFQSSGFENEVPELLGRICPKDGDSKVIGKLVACVRAAVRQVVPEAEVLGFASGDVARGTAFAVAIPDIDILLRCNPEVLLRRLQSRLIRGHNPSGGDRTIDHRRLQKSAIRACTDVMVSCGFKFRRSAFRGAEPKVTMLSPLHSGIGELVQQAIPFCFHVNNVTPLYSATLTSATAALDPRVLELGLLVKRWAKDRGICHASKGHMLPYAFHIMTVFFLQVGAGDGEPMLPPMKQFDWASCPEGQLQVKASSDEKWVAPESQAGRTIPELFKGFFNFYRNTINWTKEAVSLRLGRRGPRPNGLEAHIVSHCHLEGEYAPKYQGLKVSALAIEDPFKPASNLACNLTDWGLARMKEELNRADELCKQSASLTILLDPWVPPERPADARHRHEDEDSENEEKHQYKHYKTNPSPKEPPQEPVVLDNPDRWRSTVQDIYIN